MTKLSFALLFLTLMLLACSKPELADQSIEPGTPTPVVITAFEDRSFSFVTKTAPASYYLRKAAPLERNSRCTRVMVSAGTPKNGAKTP